MISDAEGSSGIVRSVFWRKVTPGDFFNIERTAEAGPAGGGGQLYIDIPLGGSISLQDFGNFVGARPLESDDSNWKPFRIQVYSVSSPVVAAPLILTPRRGNNRRYRIANQNRQAGGGHRHPAWSADRGFPQAPDDVSSRADSRMPDLSFLKIFIARTDRGEFYAGYTNSATMPSNWPPDADLEVLFKLNAQVKADGIIHIPADLQLSPGRLGELIASPLEPGTIMEEPYPEARVVRRSTATRPARDRDRGTRQEPASPRSDPLETITIQAPRASEAEDWVESRLSETYGHHRVRRIGHTELETIPLDDGYLPGADIIVTAPESQHPERFIEVKSAVGALPPSIRLTASELARAKNCANEGLPYDIWVVVFGESSLPTIIADFERHARNLTIDDLVSLEIQIA